MKYFFYEDAKGKAWGLVRVDKEADPPVLERWDGRKWVWDAMAGDATSGYASDQSAYREVSKQEAEEFIRTFRVDLSKVIDSGVKKPEKCWMVKTMFGGREELWDVWSDLFDEEVRYGSMMPDVVAWIKFRELYQERPDGWTKRKK